MTTWMDFYGKARQIYSGIAPKIAQEPLKWDQRVIPTIQTAFFKAIADLRACLEGMQKLKAPDHTMKEVQQWKEKVEKAYTTISQR